MVNYSNFDKNTGTLCPECDKEMTIVEKTFDTFCFCDECWDHKWILNENDSCCNSPKRMWVRHTISGGGLQLKGQCQNCYDLDDNATAKGGTDMNVLSPSNLSLDRKMSRLRELEYKEFYDYWEKLKTKKTLVRPEYNDTRYTHKEYKAYYESLKWKNKRQKVLERDNYTCLACGEREAEAVHHKNYNYFKQEPLFNLVSVCNKCHYHITMIDRGPNYERYMEELSKMQYNKRA